MCYNHSLEQVPGVEVLPSFFGMLSVTASTSFKCLSFQSFEAVELHISSRNLSVSAVCLYRPPPSRKNKLSNQLFLQEFSEFLTQFAGSHIDLVLLGDFNFHYNDCADTQVNHIKTMLSDHGLTQLIDVPTYMQPHIGFVCSSLRCELSHSGESGGYAWYL